jgi:diadenosine tetraphosphate (Ap4A) HIT family hydrolase
MNHETLLDFVLNKMRMSHIYQPVMLISLLENGGKAHEREIAKALLAHDESQIEYYTEITNNMVGQVLRNHEIVVRDRQTKTYELVGYDDLTEKQKAELISACEARLQAFVEARGKTIYDHRRVSVGYIPGTLKYEVLKRARFRCELCGTSADEKALEPDHIIPRIHGGSDDITNLQALCYSCNAMKRDRDTTDFRAIRESYSNRDSDCLFCKVDRKSLISENELAYTIRDGCPVSPLHTLVIPKRHVATLFELGQAEINACTVLLKEQKTAIELEDASVDGFNVGMNNGISAGQTISHCHIHLIPRRTGDVPNPQGGVRHVIPGKGYYDQLDA